MDGTLNRELMARDLERLASLLSPMIESRLSVLEGLRVGPVPVGRLLLERFLPPGSPHQMTSAALGRLLELDDASLVALVDAVGLELGGWRGYGTGLTDAELVQLVPATEQLRAVLG